MNKTHFLAQLRFYEHSYEHSSLICQSRRGVDMKGIYKYYICHYIFLSMLLYMSWKFWLLSDCWPHGAGGPAVTTFARTKNEALFHVHSGQDCLVPKQMFNSKSCLSYLDKIRISDNYRTLQWWCRSWWRWWLQWLRRNQVLKITTALHWRAPERCLQSPHL